MASTDNTDLALDPQTHDLPAWGYSFILASGLDRVAQQVRIRLQFFLGEWFLDTSAGLPYYEEVLKKRPDMPLVESLFKTEILTCPDVLELISFSTGYEPLTRRFRVSFRASTTFGELDFNEELNG
jgi:hypothetical protein